MLELKKLNAEELVNLQAAAQKNKSKLDANGKPVEYQDEIDKKNKDKDIETLKSIEKEDLEREQARKLNQLDDEGKKTLQREAMANLSTEELELLSSIDAEMRNKLLKLDPK